MRVLQFSLVLIVALSGADAGEQSDIWKSLAKEPEWRLTDPAYLYLIFKDRDTPGGSYALTFLHPVRLRSNLCVETFMPDHQREARAFTYRLARETPQGYEVSFQPIDPVEERPVAGKEIKVFFPRSERKLVKLTHKLSVQGFYGSPDLKHP